MEIHSCMNVTLFKHDSRRRDREERTGQDCPGRDKSRVGDVTGKKNAKETAVLVFCCPKNMETRGS